MMQNLSTLSLFNKVNLLITTLLFLFFLSLNSEYSTTVLFFMIGASISTAATLYLIFYILFLPFMFTRLLGLWVSALIFLSVNLTLIVDFFIFRIWKFHINAMVLNILLSPDSMDSIQFGVMPIVALFAIIGFFTFLEVYLFKKIIHIREIKKINRRINKFFLPLMLLIILSEKIVNGFATMYANTQYLEPTKVIPLYQPMDFTLFMEETFGLKGTPSENKNLSISDKKSLNYPTQKLLYSNAKPTNIFIFAFDSARYSIFEPSVAPNVYSLFSESTLYTNHISGGNNTRFGIFSLLYGVNSSYWFSFLNAQKGSVLFSILNELHYQTHIFSATSTAWPEFRKTVYFDIQKNISDKHSGQVYQKDEQTTEEFLSWIDNLQSDKPIFSFTFLDAPHSNSYPPSHKKFLPDANGDLNYLTVNKNDNRVLLNQYKNAIFFDDSLLGKMITKLKERGLYENSIIIFTADHGQEFYEHGNFGHNNSYNYEQVKVPFSIKWPDNRAKVVHKLTSHLDVVPTLLSAIGVTNESSNYSNGFNLRDEKYKRDFAYIGNWNENAILSDNYVHLFSNLPNRVFDNKSYATKEYKLVDNNEDKKKNTILLKVMEENSRFIK